MKRFIIFINIFVLFFFTGCIQSTKEESQFKNISTFHNGISEIWEGVVFNERKIFIGLSCGDIYESSDGKNFDLCFKSENQEDKISESTAVMNFCFYKDNLYATVKNTSTSISGLLRYTKSKVWEQVEDCQSKVSSIVVYNDLMYMSVDFYTKDYFIFDGTNLKTLKGVYSIKEFFVFNDNLFGISNDGYSVYKIEDNNFTKILNSGSKLQHVISNESVLAIPTENGTIFYTTNNNDNDFKEMYLVKSTNKTNTSSLISSYQYKDLFLFGCNITNGNSKGSIFITKNFSECKEYKDITNCGWNSIFYSSILDKFVIGGCNSEFSDGENGRGCLYGFNVHQ